METTYWLLELTGDEGHGTRYFGFSNDWLAERDSIYREHYGDCRHPDFRADGIDGGFVWISLSVDLGNDAKRSFTVYFGQFDKLSDTPNEEELRIKADLEQGEFRKIRLKCTKMKAGHE